ncbi:L-type lectin-domain containing receptor kinase S.4 [Spatholobus suberectus]|nr:L-type lectin-domain containing receptor kinase S.4 [Spatholobus suberectus]
MVEFDIVLNYEFYDINDNHRGINVNNVVSNKSVCTAQFTNESSKQDLNFRTATTSDAERSTWGLIP